MNGIFLVERGGGGASEVKNLVNLEIEGLDDVLIKELEIWIGEEGFKVIELAGLEVV